MSAHSERSGRVAVAVAIALAGCAPTSGSSARCREAVEQEASPGPVVAPLRGLGDPDGDVVQASVAAALDAALDDAAARVAAVDLSAAIITADGRVWTRTRGGPTSTRYWWASVGKAFTAMVILGLVDEGRLRLDQPIAEFAPTIANAEAITIRHLLAHTSGIYSFQADPDFRQRSGHIPPSELVAVASAHGPEFCPGSGWSYSNTGYVLLGQIIEAVEGAPYHVVVNRRILAPLARVSADAPDADPPMEALAPGASPRDLAPPAPGSAVESAPRHDLTTPFAAGVIAASSLDMARAWRRFLAGEVVSEAALATMFAEVHPLFDSPVESYGLGVMVYRLAGADPHERDVWLGHSGGTVGAKALVAWSTERQVVVAVALTGEGSPEGIALHLLQALD